MFTFPSASRSNIVLFIMMAFSGALLILALSVWMETARRGGGANAESREIHALARAGFRGEPETIERGLAVNVMPSED
jgi:hypothetical protein